ncbi:unnamed protein product, partial [Symbiodinium necroappetens]
MPFGRHCPLPQAAKREDLQDLISEVEREVLMEQLKEAESLCSQQQLKDAEAAFEDARQHLLHLTLLSETARVTPLIHNAEYRLADILEQDRVCAEERERIKAGLADADAELAKVSEEVKEKGKDLALLRRDLDAIREACYVGDTRLEAAVQQMQKQGVDVDVRYYPFMIDPSTKNSGEDKADYCRRRGWGGGWKPPDLRQWKWWPNTENAHRLCTYLDEIHAKMPELSEKDKVERSHALMRKFYELTYDRDCNISVPEGAAQAIEELGYGTAKDAVAWLNGGGGLPELRASR